MWLYGLFLLVLTIGLVVVSFMIYDWYRAVAILALCSISVLVFNVAGIEFDWLSYILGYAVCLISHLVVNINRDKGVTSKDINIDKKL